MVYLTRTLIRLILGMLVYTVKSTVEQAETSEQASTLGIYDHRYLKSKAFGGRIVVADTVTFCNVKYRSTVLQHIQTLKSDPEWENFQIVSSIVEIAKDGLTLQFQCILVNENGSRAMKQTGDLQFETLRCPQTPWATKPLRYLWLKAYDYGECVLKKRELKSFKLSTLVDTEEGQHIPGENSAHQSQAIIGSTMRFASKWRTPYRLFTNELKVDHTGTVSVVAASRIRPQNKLTYGATKLDMQLVTALVVTARQQTCISL